MIGDILGEEDGIALIDESSTVKQGGDPVGVVRQYCGSVSMIANGHVSVYVGYVSCKGYSWRDTGSCEALPANSGPKRKLQTAESFIRTEVKKHPDVLLAALCERVQEAKGIRARRCNIR